MGFNQVITKTPSWIVFISLIVLGLILHAAYQESWPLHKTAGALSDALMIAGFLGITVDYFAKNRLLREAALDISKYLIGYRLPPEIQDQIRHIQTIALVRYNFEIRYRLIPHETISDKMRVSVEMCYMVKNFSRISQTYTPAMAAEDIESPIFESITVIQGHGQTYHLSKDNQAEHLETQISPDGHHRAEGRPIIVEPNSNEGNTTDLSCKVIKRYGLILPNDYHDVVSFFHPTIGVTIQVDYPNTHDIRIDEKGEALHSGNTWEFRRLHWTGKILGFDGYHARR